MTYKELKQFKEQCYKDFIRQRYGQSEVDKLELAIKRQTTDKLLEIRSDKEFVDALNTIREEENND